MKRHAATNRPFFIISRWTIRRKAPALAIYLSVFAVTSFTNPETVQVLSADHIFQFGAPGRSRKSILRRSGRCWGVLGLIPAWFWIVSTIIAAGAQTLRTAMQRDLIATMGAAGAAYVRFLYGLPFALVFLALACAATGLRPPSVGLHAAAWVTIGALAQILATGLMLAAMRERSFVVTTAYTKTEPLQVALFGLIFLGDRVTAATALAIAVATAGVLTLSWRKRLPAKTEIGAAANWRPAAFGLGAAACFAVSAIGFRAGIRAIGDPSFVVAAATALVTGLIVQTCLILLLLAASNRPLLRAIATEWRPSLVAGFFGAFASQFWFFAFALETAARVRTLGLVEVVFAQFVSRRLFKQGASRTELLGIGLIVSGVVILLNA